MNTPILDGFRSRARQMLSVVPSPLGVASNVADRGMTNLRPWPEGLGVVSRIQGRPRLLGLGVSSDVAGAGQQGQQHIF